MKWNEMKLRLLTIFKASVQCTLKNFTFFSFLLSVQKFTNFRFNLKWCIFFCFMSVQMLCFYGVNGMWLICETKWLNMHPHIHTNELLLLLILLLFFVRNLNVKYFTHWEKNLRKIFNFCAIADDWNSEPV